MDQQTTTQQKQMLLGTAWLTASNFISRFLGQFISFLGISGWGNTVQKPMDCLLWATIFMLGFF